MVLFYWDFIGSKQHSFAERIEHLSPLYAVARFNSRQQLLKCIGSHDCRHHGRTLSLKVYQFEVLLLIRSVLPGLPYGHDNLKHTCICD